MSESEEENEHFCFYGKPLEPYDEDTIPRKRPITVEEQIATDAQGRRRFHGAFTGGFSAGFFNTVGSLEGWLPGEFKSSRSAKTEKVTQKPEDFMDDEDMGEDGIAPQVVRATNDYNTSKKRKKQIFSDGPIPGEPVLHNILSSGNETIGYMLLKHLRIKDKKKNITDQKTYGCQMPSSDVFFQSAEDNQYEIPQLYKDFLVRPKDNTFGLGYTGLDKTRFSLFPNEDKPQFKVTDRNNKKFSISGQAFGVGAFEDDDDDIYMKDDMKKYDFELASEKDVAKISVDKSKLHLGMFERSKENPVLRNQTKFLLPTIPHSFTGKHKVRRSRFEPLPEEETPSTSKINPMVRAKYLGEDYEKEYTSSKPAIDPSIKEESTKKLAKMPASSETSTAATSSADVNSYLNDRFVSSSTNEDVGNILEVVEKTETMHGTSQMRDAVRMKMFGPLTRITSDWVPHALLCKRFNVPEPFVDRTEKSRTRTKNIIFEYQKHIEQNNLQPGIKREETINETSQEINEDVPEMPSNGNATVEPPREIKPDTEPPSSITPKDITEPIHLEKQQDLFKAIFMSDSEPEEEDQTEKEDENVERSREDIRREEMKSTILSDQLIPKIKPLKEGVLSGINFHVFSKPDVKTIENNQVESKQAEVNVDPNLYGPKIPERLIAAPNTTNIKVASESEDEWIEKDERDSESREERRCKKEKKHKHKHKKKKHKKLK
ncbi:G patch domain-containing protein 1 homolog [Euwallacea similis]|uniref:G patch domain-containing protein 1 homolog n=1 Tax=Euwallacea similis TaxID=1736056 RepID=UPI00344F4187